MQGSNNDGLQCRVIQELFYRLNHSGIKRYSVKASYFEIYNEQIIDLLSLNSQSHLTIREDVNKGIFIENCTESYVNTFDQTLQLIH